MKITNWGNDKILLSYTEDEISKQVSNDRLSMRKAGQTAIGVLVLIIVSHVLLVAQRFLLPLLWPQIWFRNAKLQHISVQLRGSVQPLCKG